MKLVEQLLNILEARKIPRSLQRKIDEYDKNNWWIGKNMTSALNSLDIKKLSKALEKTLEYVNPYNSYVDLNTYQKKKVIEVVEIVSRGSKKFELAQDRGVPHMLDIGGDVLFNYVTVVDTSHEPFSISDLKDFIKDNT